MIKVYASSTGIPLFLYFLFLFFFSGGGGAVESRRIIFSLNFTIF